MRRTVSFVLAASLLAAGMAHAITAEELKELLDSGERVTLIDVRHGGAYAENHIPGAIHIPAHLCPHKQLPLLGRVIVYGDGLRPEIARRAAAELSARPGIAAEVLEGGFGRWEALTRLGTAPRGMVKERLPLLLYDQLEEFARDNPNLVILDVRGGGVEADEPGDATVSVHLARVPRDEETHICLMLDDRDGTAEAVARSLKATEVRRLAVPWNFCRQFATLAKADPTLSWVDLRHRSRAASEKLTDLGAVFPGLRILREPVVVGRLFRKERASPLVSLLKAQDPAHTACYLLIGSGDGGAERMARRMKAAGIRRFVILVGGERALARKGEPATSTK